MQVNTHQSVPVKLVRLALAASSKLSSSVLVAAMAIGTALLPATTAWAQCGSDPGNDSRGTATDLSGQCSTTSAAIDCVADVDYYRFTAPNSGSFTFQTLGDTDTYMVLQDDEGGQIAFNDDGGSGTNASITSTLTQGVTYFIKVNEFGDNNTGSYNLDVTGCTTQSCGSDPGNDQWTNSTTVNGCGTTPAAIDCAGDFDWYTFVAPSAATYTFSASGFYGLKLALYNSAGNYVDQTTSSLDRALAANERVYVLIQASVSGQTFSYDFTISGCTPAGCGSDPGNDTRGTATDLGGQCSGTPAAIDCVADVDYYRFTAPNSGSFTFETQGSTDTYMVLQDNEGGQIAVNDDGGADYNSKITSTLTQGTTYFIKINEYGDNNTGSYVLSVMGCSTPGCGSDPGNDSTGTSTALVGCGTVDAAIDCSGDLDYYAWQAPATGTYTWTVTPSNVAGLVLYADNGVTELDSGWNSVTSYMTQGEFSYLQVGAITSGDTFSYSLAITGCSGGGCGSDPGNDSIAAASTLSNCGTTNAAIDCSGDVDYYAFQVPLSNQYTFTTTGPLASAVTLFWGTAGSGGSITNGTGTISKTFSAGEWVYVKVEAATSGQTYSYGLTIEGCTQSTCGSDPGNDNLSVATPLSGCGTTPAFIDCAGDADYYSFVAPSTNSYTFETTGSLDTELRLYNALGEVIDSDDDSGEGNNARVIFPLVSGSTYSIAVNEYGNNNVGAYDLVISGCPVTCGNDPGNDYLASATPLQGCTTTAAAIDCVGDADYYRFIPPGTASYSIETTGNTDTLIKIYDAAGDVIFSDDNQGSGNNAKLIETLTGGATYSIGVFESGDDATGAYDLIVQGCPVACGNDPGNDTVGTATDLSGQCGTTPAGIDCAGDVDVYRFTAPNDGAFTFETTGDTDTYMRLLDDESSPITQDDDNGDGLNAKIVQTLTQGATYFISVHHYNLVSGTGTYSLVVSGCSAGAGCGSDPGNDSWHDASQLAACGLNRFAIDCPGDIDWYSFDAPASATYTFEANSIYISRLGLYNAAGGQIDETNTSLDHALSAGERVYILVSAATPGQTFEYDLGISGCPTGGCGADPQDDTINNPSVWGQCGIARFAIDCAGDVDWYRYTASGYATYTISAIAGNPTTVRIYDANGGLKLEGVDSVDYTLSAGETINVYVASKVAGLSFPYDFGIVGCPSSGCGADPGNDTPFTATTLAGCGTVSAGFDCPIDTDYYQFTAPNAGTFEFGTQSTGFVDISLYEQGGNPIAFGVGGLQAQLASGQVVVLKLQSATVGEVFTYVLGVSGCDTSSCGADPGDNSRATATQLSGCGTTSAAFDCAGDVDYYQFVAPVSGPYTVETTGSMDTMLWIENSNGSTIAQNDDGGQDHNARYQIDMVAGTTYYFRIEEYQGDDTGSYQLVVSGCSGSAASFEYVVPATARLTGLEDTNWSSDLMLLNMGTGTATTEISLWKRDLDNSNPQKTTVVLTPDELEKHSDVLSSLFSLSEGAAALYVASDQPLAIGSRTFNAVTLQATAQAAVTGTYGQFIPAVSATDALHSGSTGYVTGIVQNDDYRTNLGLVNPTGSSIQVKVDFSNPDGTGLGPTQTYTIPPYGYIQRTRVLRDVTSANINGAWAEIRPQSGIAFVYLSIVDQHTGDPVYKTARTVSGTSVDVVVPGIAKVGGASNTNWLSDAVLVNVANTDTTVKLTLWLRDADNSSAQEQSLIVKPKHMVRIADVLQQLFSLSTGAAALRVTGGPGLLVDARTYNQVAIGTYGQNIPAFEGAHVVHGGFRGFQIMSAQNATFRTNLGLINPGDTSIDVEVRLLDATGAQVGITKTYTVAGSGYRQIDAVITKLTNQSIDQGYLEVRLAPTSLGGSLHAYASIIDGTTGDPVFEPVVVEPPPSVPAP